MDRDAIIKLCIEEGVPIYQGKIDKHLFQAQLQARACPSRSPPDHDSLTRTGCLHRSPGRHPATEPALPSHGCSPTWRRASGLRGRLLGLRRPTCLAGLAVFAASTLALSASSRSTAGASVCSGSSAAAARRRRASPRGAPSGRAGRSSSASSGIELAREAVDDLVREL